MPTRPRTPAARRWTRPALALAALLAAILLAAALAAPPASAETGGRVRLVPFGKEEMVFIRLPGGEFSWPRTEILRGKEPRVILDFAGVEAWDETYVPDGGGSIVRRIRTYLHEQEKRLRVVLDLAGRPDDYALTLSYEIRPHGAEITVSAIPLPRKR